MPASPWRSLSTPDPDAELLVLRTFLPLSRLSQLPRFLRYVVRITRQLETANGLAGYTLLARPLRSRYWTLSAWESAEALGAFVHAEPHASAMRELPQTLRGFETVRWTVKASELPLSWDDALARS